MAFAPRTTHSSQRFAFYLLTGLLLAAVGQTFLFGAEAGSEIQRKAVPAKEQIAGAIKVVRDLFKADYANRNPADRAAFAKKLLSQGKESGDDPAAQYVLFAEARDLAVVLGDAETALAASRALVQAFAVNRAEAELDILSSLVSKIRTPDGARLLIDSATGLCEEAIEADNYDIAKRALGFALAAARKSQNTALANQLSTRAKEIEDLRKESVSVQNALAKLSVSPDDAEAHLTVGKYYAFGKGDFEAGLPHLAKGSDLPLSSVAKRDLKNPDSPEGQVSLADEWWALSEIEPSVTIKARLRAQASSWYSMALPQMKGLARTQVEMRLKIAGPQSPSSVKQITDAKWQATFKNGEKVSGIQFLPNGVFANYGDYRWTVEGRAIHVRHVSGNPLVVYTPLPDGTLSVKGFDNGTVTREGIATRE